MPLSSVPNNLESWIGDFSSNREALPFERRLARTSGPRLEGMCSRSAIRYSWPVVLLNDSRGVFGLAPNCERDDRAVKLLRYTKNLIRTISSATTHKKDCLHWSSLRSQSPPCRATATNRKVVGAHIHRRRLGVICLSAVSGALPLTSSAAGDTRLTTTPSATILLPSSVMWTTRHGRPREFELAASRADARSSYARCSSRQVLMRASNRRTL